MTTLLLALNWIGAGLTILLLTTICALGSVDLIYRTGSIFENRVAIFLVGFLTFWICIAGFVGAVYYFDYSLAFIEATEQ